MGYPSAQGLLRSVWFVIGLRRITLRDIYMRLNLSTCSITLG